MSENTFDILARNFPADRGKTAFETPEGRQVSYGELEAKTAQFANLLTRWGLKPGERVAVQVEKSVEAVLFYLACLRGGFVYLPLNTGYTRGELAYFMQDAEPSLVVCAPQQQPVFEETLSGKRVRITSLDAEGKGPLSDAAAEESATSMVFPAKADDLAALLYTSGTTGRPKGAMLSHGNLASNAEVLKRAWGMSADDVLLHALPIFHTHGLFVAINTLLMAGGTILLLPKFDADTVLRLLPRATVMMGVPTFYTRLLAREDFTRQKAEHIRLFISGSAPLLTETFAAFEARTGQRILERYGMTEINMHCSNPLEGERRPGTVGPPLPGLEVRVVSQEDGETELPPGEVGVLQVRGPNVFQGYWKRPEANAKEFTRDGYFITGDLATLSEDGYVSIVGRDKDLIITGGFNVYPKEVESLLDRLPGVEESAVFGVAHPDFGEAVVAALVPKTGEKAPDQETVVEALKGELAKYKLPKQVVTLDELPRNAMGKVQKNRLREEYGGMFGG